MPRGIISRWEIPGPQLSFDAFARRPDADLDLLTGAALIARDARPGVNFEAIDRTLDELAVRLGDVAGLQLSEQAEALALELGERFGLRGNNVDYQDPDNSFIDQVLSRKIGLPISLSLIYVEVGRRAGLQISGVGFPGHFLVRLDALAGSEHLLLDPFGGGRALDQVDLELMLDRVGWPRQALQHGLVDPSPHRLVLARMLTNLRSVYLRRAELPQLLVVLDRLVALIPESKEALRDRALVQAELGAPQAARADLIEYLRRWPTADDAEEVRGLLRRVAQVNSDDLN